MPAPSVIQMPPATPARGSYGIERAGLVLLLAGTTLLPLMYWVSPHVRTLDYLGVYALAFWTAWLALRRARMEGPKAFGWLGLGAALGGLHYLPSHIQLAQAELAGPAISILAICALGAGFLLWPQQARMSRDRIRTALDGIALALSVFTAAWMALDTLDWVGHLARSLALVYALQIGTILGVLALWLLQKTRLMLPEQARTKRYVRAALIVLLCHGFVSALLRVTGHNQGYPAHAAGALHQVAIFMLGLAAITPPSAVEPGPSRPAPTSLHALLPSVMSLAVLLLAAFHLLQPHAVPQRTLMSLGFALLGVLILRHGLLILDLERLSRSLEARVEERTLKLEAHHREAMSDLRMRIMAGLAAGLAHDLNNILGIIRLRVDLLEPGCTPLQKNHLKVLEDTSDRAIAMTRRILASSRMQESSPSAFDFTAWMNDRGSRFRALLQHQQQLELRLAGDLQVHADPQSLKQIFENLVSNARDAMGPEGRLLICARAHAGGVQVEIRDDGPGIPPEHQAQMFDPFFTTKSKGTGLGLATVRNLVLQNRGAIQVESEPGRGTAFHLELPAPERLLLA